MMTNREMVMRHAVAAINSLLKYGEHKDGWDALENLQRELEVYDSIRELQDELQKGD